jgi:Chloramphenicol O-acetyltransferase
MKQIIDRQTWKRRDNYSFFENFLNPCISVTSEVVCTVARQKAKERGQSFFLYYLYAILKTVNQIEEFRYRVMQNGQVVLYDTVDVLAPISINEDGQFATVRIPWNEDFDTFHDTARQLIKSLAKDEDPYAYTREEKKSEDDKYNVILVSATPDLYFTSMNHTQEFRTGSPYPLLNVGKAVMREGNLVIPIAINVHHGFVDGKHISDFFQKVESFLL